MRTLTFFINLSLFLSILSVDAQNIGINKEQPKDTVIYKTGYGLRVGVDLSKAGLSFFDKSYKGFEIVGDYRVSSRWYIAAEIGHEEEITFEDFTTSTAKGNYIRVGANYNTYNNWLDMNNEIYVGGRYGVAIFDHTLNSYTPNVTTGDTSVPIYFPSTPITTPVTETGLNAQWLEFVFGIKAETFKNLFIGFSGSFKIATVIEDQTGFKTLYAPGFNEVLNSSTGFGFNYTLTYLIPFVNK
ncbi:conserved exported hypothetical protein [Tenacibaculum sp. 190524A05c]|uniref:DUF6048 family protein n=1 Tax=Tenacibaculum platacis TaxID=3137852 RepID=UPI0031FB98F4